MTVLAILLLFGPLLGLFGYGSAAAQEREDAWSEFDEHLLVQVSAVREQTLTIVEALHSVRAFFVSSDLVTRREFATFTRDMRARLPTILAAEWIPRIPANMRARHVAEARAEGLSDYDVRELGADGSMVPAGARAEYFPVFYAEPLAGNACVIGFDLGSEEVRRSTLEAATAADGVRISDPLSLVQEEHLSSGILAILPIRKSSDPAAGKRPELSGFALIAFRIDDLVGHSILAGAESRAPRMQFRLTDPEVRGGAQTLYQSEGYTEAFGPEARSVSASIETGGQTWTLTGHPTEDFFAARRTDHPFQQGVSVFLIWSAFFGSLFLLARRSRDRSLREQDRLIRSVLNSLTEGVVVAGPDGRILLANEAARTIAGIDPDSSEDSTDSMSRYFLPDGITAQNADEFPLARAVRGETVLDQPVIRRDDESTDSRWLNVSGTPLRDERRELCGGVAVFRDITGQRKSEESVHRLSSALQQTADMVIITDREGTIEYVNTAFETVFGYSKEEALGQNPRILKSGQHGEEYYESLWNAVRAGKVFRATTVNKKKCGDLIHTEQTITPMLDGESQITHYVSVYKDMTDKRQRDEQETELRVAGLVQERLYPPRAPQVEGLDIAGAVFPAEATCGDYYDYIPAPDGGLVAVVGDVSGHGLGPALVMAQTRAYLRPLLGSHADLAEAFSCLNRFLYADLEANRFVTLLAARFDRDLTTLEWASAGHSPAYVIDGNGAVKHEMLPTGPAIGFFDRAAYRTCERVALDSEDLMLLITDGVTESRAPDGSFFEDEGVLEIAMAHRHETSKTIVKRIYDAARAYAGDGPQLDDITILVVKVNRCEGGAESA